MKIKQVHEQSGHIPVCPGTGLPGCTLCVLPEAAVTGRCGPLPSLGSRRLQRKALSSTLPASSNRRTRVSGENPGVGWRQRLRGKQGSGRAAARVQPQN